MYKSENLTVNGGDLPVGASVKFDLPIGWKWCKPAYLKIVQLTAGAMEITIEVWETGTYTPTRAELYQRKLMRTISLAVVDGGEYGEIIEPQPMPYQDRDGVQDSYNIHCRLTNNPGGTNSDFAVSFDIAEIGEVI